MKTIDRSFYRIEQGPFITILKDGKQIAIAPDAEAAEAILAALTGHARAVEIAKDVRAALPVYGQHILCNPATATESRCLCGLSDHLRMLREEVPE